MFKEVRIESWICTFIHIIDGVYSGRDPSSFELVV